MESVSVVPVSLFEPPKVSCQGLVLQYGETAKEQESLAVKKKWRQENCIYQTFSENVPKRLVPTSQTDVFYSSV